MTHESDIPEQADQPFVDPTGFPYPHQPSPDEAEPGDSGASQSPPTTEQIRTTTGREAIYAWEMFDSERGWNIIGMRMPNGATLPMVTTSIENAWSMFEIAQQHANASGLQCRLAGWARPDVIAIVDPEVER